MNRIVDAAVICARLHWLLPSVGRSYPATPRPWARCHCGALATIHEITDWCMPCKYAVHTTCECSRSEEKQ